MTGFRFVASSAVAHEATYPSRKDEYGPGSPGLLDLGLAQSGTTIRKSCCGAKRPRAVRLLFESVDLIAVPAQPSPRRPSPRWLRSRRRLADCRLLRFTCPFDMTGSPTITLPAVSPERRPVAFQFVGRHFDEAALVRAGDAFQRVTDWHTRHPAL